MPAILFTVLTDCLLGLAAIVALVVWINAGCPFWTVTRR